MIKFSSIPNPKATIIQIRRFLQVHSLLVSMNYVSSKGPVKSLFPSGSAVYIYCILALTSVNPAGNSDMKFYIDNEVVGTFVRPPPGTSGFEYDVLVYFNASIPHGAHQLMIQNGRINGPKSLVMLDAIIYS